MAANAIIKYEGKLLEILPKSYQKKYTEMDLQIISDGLTNPIKFLEDKELIVKHLLIQIGNEMGFGINSDDNSEIERLKASTEIILANYIHWGVEQIRRAFILAPRTGADLESWGKGFHAPYVVKVLAKYDEYVKDVLPKIQKAAEIAANRQAEKERQEKMAAYELRKKAFLKRQYYLTVAKGIVDAKIAIDADSLDIFGLNHKAITVLSEIGLVNLTTEQKIAMKSEAKELAAIDLARQLAVIDKTNLEVSKKIIRKRDVLRLKDALIFGQKAADGIVTAYWCRVGLREWLKQFPRFTEIAEIENFKKSILAAFVEKGFLIEGDNFEL